MNEFLTHFHFLRPAWLLLIVPGIIFAAMALHRTLRSAQWDKVIDPELQNHMLDARPGKQSYVSAIAVFLASLIAAIAIAGPSWQRSAVPLVKNPDALILMMDMSLSMNSTDMAPNRATRAVRKATDIVRGREDGVTAVIAYSGEAHTVVPFTDDKATVEHLLTSLSPEIMPKLGSRPDKALIQAQALMTDAGISEASILMITDGILEKDIERIRATIPVDTTLSLIAVGTAEGAPISIGEQGFLKLDDGTIVLPRLDTSSMQALYKSTGSRWRMLSYDDSDWRALIDGPTFNDADKSQQDTQKDTLEVWQDNGYWLAFLLIPIAILGFRRGVLFSVVLFVIPSLPQPAMAGIWQTDNQEAAALLETDPAQAANLFTDPEWQGAAHYRAGDYEAAADAFAKSDSAEASYNRGNARAMQGQYDQAIDAYRDALKKDPNLKAAQQNLDVVEQALEEQEKQNSQSGDGDNSDKSESNESENNESGESEPGNNESSQNDSQSQESSEQNSQQGSDQNQRSEQQPDQTAGQDQENSESASGSDSESESADSEQAQSQSQQKQDDEYAEQQANKQAQKQETAESEKQTESQSPENGDNIEQSDLKQSDKEQSNTEPSSTNPQQDSDEAPAEDSPFQHLSREQQAAMESVLNEVEDNPGLLMQRKFLYQYRQNADQSEEDVLW
ncbi:hypothetical protein NBRC116585_00610 [Thalassolituus maritimus]|uniref:VWFA domain-containing protein n=2 Tax=Thalassolituus maritimus TaxID=484498 RepID=A0ABP9ZUY3_9GAMM